MNNEKNELNGMIQPENTLEHSISESNMSNENISQEEPVLLEEDKIQKIDNIASINTPNIETNDLKCEMPKNNNLTIMILVVSIIIICILIGIYLLLNNKNNSNQDLSSDTTKTDFLVLAQKYVTEVNKLWTNDQMLCQNATNQSEVLVPSLLSTTDAYNGNAFYYVFINTKDNNEIKLNVISEKDVAGWIRISKSDRKYYVALSDGKNYIVDSGTEFGIPSSLLTEKDVITTGNGFNYQYYNGGIFGSNTEGNGWGIGDYKLLTDGDDSNDGIYMSNGLKTSGYTPFCTNINE